MPFVPCFVQQTHMRRLIHQAAPWKAVMQVSTLTSGGYDRDSLIKKIKLQLKRAGSCSGIFRQ